MTSATTNEWELRTPLLYGSKHEGFYPTLDQAKDKAFALGYERWQEIDKVVYAEDDDE